MLTARRAGVRQNREIPVPVVIQGPPTSILRSSPTATPTALGKYTYAEKFTTAVPVSVSSIRSLWATGLAGDVVQGIVVALPATENGTYTWVDNIVTGTFSTPSGAYASNPIAAGTKLLPAGSYYLVTKGVSGAGADRLAVAATTPYRVGGAITKATGPSNTRDTQWANSGGAFSISLATSSGDYRLLHTQPTGSLEDTYDRPAQTGIGAPSDGLGAYSVSHATMNISAQRQLAYGVFGGTAIYSMMSLRQITTPGDTLVAISNSNHFNHGNFIFLAGNAAGTSYVRFGVYDGVATIQRMIGAALTNLYPFATPVNGNGVHAHRVAYNTVTGVWTHHVDGVLAASGTDPAPLSGRYCGPGFANGGLNSLGNSIFVTAE